MNLENLIPRNAAVVGTLAAILTAILSCAGCQSVKLPTVLGDKPSSDEIQQAVNRNSAKIKTLVAANATLGAANVPGWAKCRLAFERPGRVRVMGTANMLGRVFDAGANDQVYWYWDKFQSQQQLSWCKKSELPNAYALREAIPIDPTWFPEAVGIVEFKSGEVTEGPLPQSDGTLLLISKRTYLGRQFSKYTYIEPKSAAVKRQDLQDTNGEILFTVKVNEFQVDAVNGIVLPKKVSLSSPQTKETINLDLGSMEVNGEAIPANTFEMPQSADVGNVPVVNVAALGAPLSSANKPSQTPNPVNAVHAANAQSVVPPVSQPTAPTASPAVNSSLNSNPAAQQQYTTGSTAHFQTRVIAN